MAADTAQARWSFTRAGALVDLAGTGTGIPMVDTVRFRKTPRLLGSRNGRLTVAWEAAASVPRLGSDPDADRIDVASFDGQRWSAAQTIIGAQRVTLTGPPAVRAGLAFDPQVVASVAHDSLGQFIRVARRVGEAWSTADWRGAVFLSDATASLATDGSMVVVMHASMRSGITGVYSVRAGWANDRVTWAQPQLIDSISGGFTGFSSARLGGDSLVVVWHQTPTDGGPLRGMMTALSVDAGRTWKLTAPLAVSAGVDDEQLVVDADGRLHVVYRGARQVHVLNAPGAIMHSTWRSGAWTTPGAVSTDESVTGPALGSAPGGRLMATWTEAVSLPEGTAPRSLASLWTPGCAPR
jgi:hypothetical protein